ncbi:LytR C-terminal domain-containing protein [Sebaldella sp. S0638]|uniref:LytR C-terminal domain-containing protein n=1 Tax=Sebaldella sp. S0638 TaxID=2957809 RepID=UPI00209E384D|nr:LytR C-terminal domain-containing protein [Sebaldella sp. S0638]MCP1223956.1 LytR C-terminal domain-containing protein [Sebaldella sp. S0638]
MKKIILILVSLFMIFGCIEYESKDVADRNRVFKSDNNFYVYYNGKFIEIPKGTYIANDKKIENYYIKKIVNKSELLNDLNKYFPDKIEYVTKGEKPKESIKLPVITSNGKTYIDSVKLEKLLVELPTRVAAQNDKENIVAEDKPVSLEGKTIEILNANGVDGFASSLGDALKAKFKIVYNAENYTQEENYSYIINNKLDENAVNELLSSLSLKYIKKMKPGQIKPDADLVIITGKDVDTGFKTEIMSAAENSAITEKLKAYTPVFTKADKYKDIDLKKLSGIQINYNPEDYYTAYKLGKLLNTTNLVEDPSLKDSIIILTKD